MKYRVFALVCAAALVLLTGCTQPEQEPPETPSTEASETASAVEPQEAVVPEEAPLPADQELARMVTGLRTADPAKCDIVWDRGESYAGLRVTRELLGGIANLLATEPHEAIAEGADGAMYTDGGVAVALVMDDMSEGYASESLDIYLLSDNGENGEQAGKMRLSFSGNDGELQQYVFEKTSYQALETLLEGYLSSGQASFQGNYVLVGETGAEDFSYAYARHCVQVGKQLLCVWEPSDGTAGSILAALDTATGALADRVELGDNVQRMERVSGEEYSVRLLQGNTALYLNGEDLSSPYKYSLPASVSGALWAEDLSPYDVDIAAGVIAYTAEDGIYLAASDGTGAQKLLDNGDIGQIVADMELPDHQGSQLHYISPVLLEGGKKLAATVYMLSDGNYEPANYAVSVVDVQSGQASHYPGFLAWLAFPASKLDDTTLMAFGGDGVNLLDITTGETRMVELDRYMDVTHDYATFVRTEDWTRNQDGEKIYEISVFTVDKTGNRSEPQTVLTARADYVNVWHVTEEYILCAYSTEGQEGQSIVIVPLP